MQRGYQQSFRTYAPQQLQQPGMVGSPVVPAGQVRIVSGQYGSRVVQGAVVSRPGYTQGGQPLGFQAVPQESERERLDRLLRDTNEEMTNILRQCYKDALRGRPTMGPAQLKAMAPLVYQRLRIPPESLAHVALDKWFGRFDFNGDGTLSDEEAIKLFRRCIREYRIAKCGPDFTVDVPKKTPRDAGLVFIKDLGAGGQGAMKLYQNDRGEHKCVKFYEKANANAGGIDELRDEFAIMKQLTNPHIARTFEVFQDNTFYYLINEPYFGGDLTKITRKVVDAGIQMTEGWWRDIFVQCFEGLDYLHRSFVMHCDIKEPNIMVANDDFRAPHIVLIDFGLSASFSGQGVSGGTPGYMPPETLDDGIWYPKGDTWSMGVVMWQLLTGHVPQLENPPYVEGLFHQGIFDALNQGRDPMDHIETQTKRMAVPFDVVPYEGARDLLSHMLERDRKKRWKVTQCLQHEWCADFGAGLPVPEEIVTALQSLGIQSEAQEAVIERFVERMNLAECRNMNMAFEAADKDHNGTLDAQEGVDMLAEMGIPEDEQQAILDSLMDPDTKMITYKRFMEKLLAMKVLQDVQFIQELFDELDADKSGFLDKEELRRLMHPSMLTVADDNDVERLLQSMDANNDGVVSFEEFRRVVTESGSVTAAANRVQE